VAGSPRPMGTSPIWVLPPVSATPSGAASRPGRCEGFRVRALDGALPAALVEEVRQRLGADSSYWPAHRYDEEDVAFYSHVHRLGQEAHIVDQLIEALRPALAAVAPEVAEQATMAEWWVHRRRRDQWHGHPMHYDTDELTLRTSRGACVRHPAISTVVYLCDDTERFGPTLVTNQRAREPLPQDHEVAVLVRPRLGRILFFDGGYLHGALPGRPWLASPDESGERLNLMVGWWTCPISPSPASETPQPLMEVDAGAAWVRSLGLAEPSSTVGAGAGAQVPLKAVRPIWADVPRARASGKPFAGRFFLTHRGQVDEDMFK